MTATEIVFSSLTVYNYAVFIMFIMSKKIAGGINCCFDHTIDLLVLPQTFTDDFKGGNLSCGISDRVMCPCCLLSQMPGCGGTGI